MGKSLKKQAKRIARKGRKGDDYLLHVNREELLSLMGTGRVTKNPETGLPEAFNLAHSVSSFFDNPISYLSQHDPFGMGSSGAPAMPGSAQALGKAIQKNDFGNPFSSGQNSYDIFAGGDSSKDPYARFAGRTVGTAFAGVGLGDLFGAGSTAGASDTGTGDAPVVDPNTGFPASTGGDVPPTDSSVLPGAEDIGFPTDVSPASGPTGGLPELPAGSDPLATPMSFDDPSTSPSLWDDISKYGKLTLRGMQVGAGAYGLYNSYEGRQAQKKQQQQQQAYFDQLNQLMANPNSVKSLPGYQFGLNQGNEALARRMASMGYGTSGNLALATQQFGTDYATQALALQEQLLAGQYGRAAPPTATMPDPTRLAMQSLTNLGYGFG